MRKPHIQSLGCMYGEEHQLTFDGPIIHFEIQKEIRFGATVCYRCIVDTVYWRHIVYCKSPEFLDSKMYIKEIYGEIECFYIGPEESDFV